MKRLVLLVLGIAAAATGAHAQSNAELIEGALAAAPVRARDAAAVIQWNADFTYETLKEGEQQTQGDLRRLLEKPLGDIRRAIDADNPHIRGLALEALAVRLMSDADLIYVTTRLRARCRR